MTETPREMPKSPEAVQYDAPLTPAQEAEAERVKDEDKAAKAARKKKRDAKKAAKAKETE